MMKKWLLMTVVLFSLREGSAQTTQDLSENHDQAFFFKAADRSVEEQLYLLRKEGKLYFQLQVIRENCKTVYQGEAMTMEGDPEMIEDEEGNASPAQVSYGTIAQGEVIILEDLEKTWAQIKIIAPAGSSECLPQDNVKLNAE